MPIMLTTASVGIDLASSSVDMSALSTVYSIARNIIFFWGENTTPACDGLFDGLCEKAREGLCE